MRESVPLEVRVHSAAEAILQAQQSVSAIEVLERMNLLPHQHILSWRKGAMPSLVEHIPCSSEKLRKSLQLFQQWAKDRNLVQVETPVYAYGGGELKYTLKGDPAEEAFFRARFLSPSLTGAKQEGLRAKLSKAPELGVVRVAHEAKCSECGRELRKGSMLVSEGEHILCLGCADMDHLYYLPAGNATASRRAKKYSRLSAAVMKWSRSRKRYEREGQIVERDAAIRAQEEALPPEEWARVKELEEHDTNKMFIREMTAAVLALFPGATAEDARRIALDTEAGDGGKRVDPAAVRDAVIASVRHSHTGYDELRTSGRGRREARAEVQPEIDRLLTEWQRSG